MTPGMNATLNAFRRHLAGAPLRLPECGLVLWRIFLDLHGARRQGDFGPDPIGFAEIEAYARLNRWPLAPHHVDAIRTLDRTWLDHALARKGNVATPVTEALAVNPAAFDAVFG